LASGSDATGTGTALRGASLAGARCSTISGTIDGAGTRAGAVSGSAGFASADASGESVFDAVGISS
jgi:hypothetical protein